MSKNANENYSILKIIYHFFVIGTCVILWAYLLGNVENFNFKIEIKDKDLIEADSLTHKSRFDEKE